VSPSYGVRDPAAVGIATLQAELPFEVTWMIGPHTAGDDGPRLIAQLDEAAAAAAPID
jgi:hypothetical protein